MAITSAKKKPAGPKKLETMGRRSRCSLCCDVISRIPTIVLAFMLIFLWSSSSTIITSNIVHVCVSSRKLTSLYCLSASTRPNMEIPLTNDTFTHLQQNTTDTNQDSPTLSGEILSRGLNAMKEAVYAAKSAVLSTTGGGKDYDLEQAKQTSKMQMGIHRSWAAREKHGGCENGGIYVYDLPAKFNKDLIAQCGEMMQWMKFCHYFQNDALGDRLPELGDRWYKTHQYALEPIFHSRILNHQCRVYEESKARMFYVPYYGGLDILRWHFKNVSNDVKDSLGLELMALLKSKESWKRNSGKDHVFVLGKISWDFRRYTDSSWGTRFLLLEEMRNPIRLLIERQPWEINDIGIPHPTHFHPHDDNDIVEWQLRLMQSSRRNLVSFAGAARPEQVKSIRSSLISQCNSAGGNWCKFFDCGNRRCDQPSGVIQLFMESEFCLQPPGDSPTRKSVFDSLIAGCIPVLFDPFTAYYQYAWHLPEGHQNYSVFIEQEDVRKGKVDVVEVLKKVSAKEKERMLKFIVYEILPGLVYGDKDSHFDKFQDAFTVTVNNLLERASSF